MVIRNAQGYSITFGVVEVQFEILWLLHLYYNILLYKYNIFNISNIISYYWLYTIFIFGMQKSLFTNYSVVKWITTMQTIRRCTYNGIHFPFAYLSFYTGDIQWIYIWSNNETSKEGRKLFNKKNLHFRNAIRMRVRGWKFRKKLCSHLRILYFSATL